MDSRHWFWGGKAVSMLLSLHAHADSVVALMLASVRSCLRSNCPQQMLTASSLACGTNAIAISCGHPASQHAHIEVWMLF